MRVNVADADIFFVEGVDTDGLFGCDCGKVKDAAVFPCSHSFKCFDCMQEMKKRGNIRCEICKKNFEEVEKLIDIQTNLIS